MKRTILFLFLISLACVCTRAGEDYIIEIKPTKKVIHVDRLGVSDNTAIMDILESMPEVLGRVSKDGSVLSNFSIQVDGKDVGQSRDVVLQQTIAASVDVIEVATSPTVSEQKNGTGGVINIKLKPIAHEGVSGIALLSLSSEWDVQPFVSIDYKKDKLELRSMLLMEYYRPTIYDFSSTNEQISFYESNDTTRTNYLQETAKFLLRYQPTQRDKIELHAWESYATQKNDQNIGHTVMQLIDTDTYHQYRYQEAQYGEAQDLTAEASFNYEHQYNGNKGSLEMELKYSYMPRKTYVENKQENISTILGGNSYDTAWYEQHPHEASVELCSKHILLQLPDDILDLKYGINTKYQFGHARNEISTCSFLQPTQYDTITSQATNLFVSPYLEMNYQHKIWFFQAGARYQYYREDFHDETIPTNYSDRHTVTGNISASCNIQKNHNLRLIAARNVRRLDDHNQIRVYPYYNVDLNYIFHWHDSLNSVVTSAGMTYIYAEQPTEGYSGTACVYAQLIYQHGIFSMAFAGNTYVSRLYHVENAGNRCWYYNLSILPVFNFRYQWTLSGKLVYHSKMATETTQYSDCVYTRIRVAKTIKSWNISLEISDIFDYNTYSTTTVSNLYTLTTKDDLYRRYVQIGASYRF